MCDDSFEEHVLPYPPEKSGLHLHGLNKCSKAFATLPTETVDAFAKEFGFITTLTTTVNSVAEVREFTDEVGETGVWQGEAVEGFVVRTHVTEPPTDGRKAANLSPYKPGSTFFFKVKFDEPYMMYRNWREITRSVLSHGGNVDHVKIPKNKLNRAESRVYLKWVKEEIKRDRKSFDGFNNGHGIIATRERFLSWLETPEGQKALKTEGGPSTPTSTRPGSPDLLDPENKAADKSFGKTIIVPVAIPGCGVFLIYCSLVAS